MASFFTRALDRLTPWNRGGEVQRRNEKKKKKEEEQYQRSNKPTISVRPAQPTQRIVVDTPLPKPQQPTNIFETLNRSLTLNQPNRVGVVPVVKTPDVQPVPIPKPGVIVRPDIPTQRISNITTAPNQNVRVPGSNTVVTRSPDARIEQADPNIVAKNTSLREKISKTPFLSATRVGTGLIQGGAGLYDLATPGKGQNRLTQATNKQAEELDKFAKEIGVNKAYKGLNIPLEVATYFAAAPSKATKAPSVVQKLVKLIGGGSKGRRIATQVAEEVLDPRNIAQEARLTGRYTGQDSAQGTPITPKYIAENAALSLLGTAGPAILRNLRRGKGADVRRAVDEVEAGIGAATAGEVTNRVRVPVRKDIPIDEVVGDNLDIPVSVRTPEKPTGPVIREVTGDAIQATPDNVIADRAAEIRRGEAEAVNNATLPDRAIEGVTPRAAEKPFVLNPEEVRVGQDKLVDEYADFLRNIGEGNGVSITPDGRRLSDNVRFGDTGGKRMTKAMWRDEAERQLRAGKADPSIQKIFDDATDPEVQAMLTKGERPDVPEGQPITVKTVNGINVIDNTNVPQNLPETPGTVRVTQATAPSNAKSAAVAAQTPPTPPSKSVETPPTTPAVQKEADKSLDDAYERLVKSLKENQTAQRVEKKINSAEKSRRFAEKKRIYDEMVASGMSRKEAEQRATAALKGKYTDNTVANFDVNSEQAETFRKAIDEVSDDPFNTKRAFEHMIDPNKTDPLQPWERTRIRKFVQATLGDDAAQSLEEAIVIAEKGGDRSLMGNIASFVTSVTASGDISATGRQGLQGLINHPVMSKRAFTDAMGALVDPKKAEDFVNRLVADPDTAFMQENIGTHFLSLADVADEARGGSDWAEKFAGTRWFVNPSERHYNTYLDSLRQQQTKAILNRYGGQNGFLKAAEASNSENPDKWMKAWGKVINAASGRGSFGKSGSPAVGDVQILFSARNLASKFQRLLAPADLKLLKTNPDAYLYQLKEVSTTTAALGAALVGASASGLVDVENGKIKIGNSRYDITGGFATIINSMNNLRKAAFDPKEGGLSRTAGDVTKDFLQNQLSPLVGNVARILDVNWSEKKDKYGNPVDARWLLERAPLPAPLSTALNSALEGEGWMQTAGNVFANALGVNVNTYQSAADKKAAAGGSSPTAEGEAPGGATDYASFKDQVPAEGHTLTQLDDGSYAYSLNGEPHQTKSLKTAQEAIAKDTFTQSGEDSQILKDKYYYKDENGDTKVMPLYKHEFDVEDSQNQLDMYIAKDDEDYASWNESATKQLKALETLRDKYNKDSQEDKVDDVQKKIETLKHEMKKYKGYGGAFTKGRGSGSGSKSIDTSFGTLRSSPFAPRVQEYAGIDQKSGSVPVIRTVRPNIVHKISSS